VLLPQLSKMKAMFKHLSILKDYPGDLPRSLKRSPQTRQLHIGRFRQILTNNLFTFPLERGKACQLTESIIESNEHFAVPFQPGVAVQFARLRFHDAQLQ
jgi:hypothetical protein